MTSEVCGASWRARYPDLAGRVAVVGGSGEVIPAVVGLLASNGMGLAVVSRARETIEEAVASAEAQGAAVFGVVAEPTDPATWTRVGSHAEQRLGPLDILVTVGIDLERRPAVQALTPDMGARRRGVVVEVGEPGDLLPLPDGVRHRLVIASADVTPMDIAATVAICASDVLSSRSAEIRLRR